MDKILVIGEDLDPRLTRALLEKGVEVSVLAPETRRSLRMQLAFQAMLMETSEAELNYVPDRGNKPAYRNTLPRRQSRY